MLTLKAKRASFTLLGVFIRVIPPSPLPPLYLRPWEEDLGAATPGRDCSQAPATERLYAPRSPPLVSLGTRTRARPRRGAPFPGKLSADVRARRKDGGGGGVPASLRIPTDAPSISERERKNGWGEKEIVNLPAHVTSMSFALRSGASTTRRR